MLPQAEFDALMTTNMAKFMTDTVSDLNNYLLDDDHPLVLFMVWGFMVACAWFMV